MRPNHAKPDPLEEGVHPKREECTLIVKTVGGTKRRIFVSFDMCSDHHHRDLFLSQGRKSDATWHVSHLRTS